MTAPEDWTTGEPRLLAQHCSDGHVWYLPRTRCPVCGAEVTSFEPRGTGVVFAQTTLHRRTTAVSADNEAIGIALVDLDEGMRMMARCAPGTPIGSRVVVSIILEPGSQQLLPRCEVIAA